ncbi:hypothetical protein D3C80_1579670 [compost metagenome]
MRVTPSTIPLYFTAAVTISALVFTLNTSTKVELRLLSATSNLDFIRSAGCHLSKPVIALPIGVSAAFDAGSMSATFISLEPGYIVPFQFSEGDSMFRKRDANRISAFPLLAYLNTSSKLISKAPLPAGIAFNELSACVKSAFPPPSILPVHK